MIYDSKNNNCVFNFQEVYHNVIMLDRHAIHNNYQGNFTSADHVSNTNDDLIHNPSYRFLLTMEFEI